MLSALYAVVHLSIRVFVTWVDQSKTVEVRIMKFLPYCNDITLVFEG